MLQREKHAGRDAYKNGMRAVGIPNLTLPESYDSQAALQLGLSRNCALQQELQRAAGIMVRISVLHDALKTMYNAEKRGKRQVLIRPSSKVVIKFLQVMMKHGEQLDLVSSTTDSHSIRSPLMCGFDDHHAVYAAIAFLQQ